jgi:hypothetical protein
MERRRRKRSSSAGSEKMEIVSDRKKMEGHCSTGHSPLRAVQPMEEEVVPELPYSSDLSPADFCCSETGN